MLALERAKISLLKARTITCFSGAGISAESGISTYRDPLAGLWSQYDPEKLETAKAFQRILVWFGGGTCGGDNKWLGRSPMLRTEHSVKWRQRGVPFLSSLRMLTICMKRAGFDGVLHLHGSLATPKCFACHRPAELAQDRLAVPVEGALIEPPRCRRCGGELRARSGLVWRGSVERCLEVCDVIGARLRHPDICRRIRDCHTCRGYSEARFQHGRFINSCEYGRCKSGGTQRDHADR